MDKQRSFCRSCGTRWPDEKLSNRGLCLDCVTLRVVAAVTQLQAQSGPIYEKWRQAYIAAMYGVLDRLGKEQEQDDLPF